MVNMMMAHMSAKQAATVRRLADCLRDDESMQSESLIVDRERFIAGSIFQCHDAS